jgi:transposase
MGLNKDATQRLAEEHFIRNFTITQKEISEIYQVTTKTVSKWATQNKWDEQRSQYHSSPVKIQQILRDEILWVSQGNPPRINADVIIKLQASLDRMEKKIDAFVVHEILKAQDNFISEIDPEFAVKLTGYNKKFLHHRVNLEVQ